MVAIDSSCRGSEWISNWIKGQSTLCWSLCSLSQTTFPWREEEIKREIEENASHSRIFFCLDMLLAPSVPLCVDLKHHYSFDERNLSLGYGVHILCLSFK